VDSAGVLDRGVGGASSVQTATGDYKVTFSSDVSNCAYTASIGDVGSATGTAGITRTRSGPTTSSVVVETFRISTNGSLLADDYPFHLVVFC
jgi:hypothetical protein